MRPRMQSPDAEVAVEGGIARWLAWASFLLALVFPMTFVFFLVDNIVANRIPRDLLPSDPNPLVAALYAAIYAALYTVANIFEWPFPLLAVILGHVALAHGGRGRTLALIGLVLGYLSILVVLGIILEFAHGCCMQQ